MPSPNVETGANLEGGRGTATEGPGRGFLRIERHGSRSVVCRAFATSPLRLLTPRNHGRAAWVYMCSYGGGLVDGDSLRLDVHVGRGGMGFLSTQASTKVYRSPRGTSIDGRYWVDAGGVLIVVPDPIVCFAASSCRLMQQFELDRDAGLVVVDSILSGRRAAGERWAFNQYVSRMTISGHGQPILHDALSLSAADGSIADRLGRFDAICSIAIAGSAFRAEAARLLTMVAQTPVTARADLIVGASAVGEGAAILRIASVSTERVVLALREYLSFVVPLLGDDPWRRRW
jgi:urease accessory protein